jgi:ribonuclease VapC
MVVDSSALIAVLCGEAEGPALIEALASPERKLMSAVNRLETAIVLEARKGEAGARSLSRLMATADVETIAFDAGQAEIALDAWRRYGKGRHPAGLNLGDCAAYALAALTKEKLLFEGDDFTHTDIAPRD